MINTVIPTISADDIKRLNQRYRALSPTERVAQLYLDFKKEEILLTSSFAATSAMLLRLFSSVNEHQTVHFIDTGYHFKETLFYKDYLTQLYDLDVVNIRAETWKHKFTETDQTYTKDTDHCCSINKVEPIEKLRSEFTVWASGLMAWQSKFRASLYVFEYKKGILKFYPLIDVSREERDSFIQKNHLPPHPLVAHGYLSIGCKHCTVPGESREGRWSGSNKSECGLHG